MRRIFAIVGIITALVLAGCAGGGAMPTLDPALNDWCYTFDFSDNANGFAIEAGEINVLGLQTDPSGLLLASYGYDRRVIANSVVVSVRRPAASVGDITVNADSTIFSVKAQLWDQVLPGAVEQIYLPYEMTEPVNEGPLTPYDYIRIHLEASQPLIIETIQVRGDGPSPFPENECQIATNTPTADPGTPFAGSTTPTGTLPTATPTPTGTLPTPTPTPTTDPDAAFCYTWDFETSDGGWVNVDGYGTWNASSGWDFVDTAASGNYRRAVAIVKTIGATITSASVEYTYTAGIITTIPNNAFGFNVASHDPLWTLYDGSVPEGDHLLYSDEADDPFATTQLLVYLNASVNTIAGDPDYSGDAHIHRITIHGTGTTAGLSGGSDCDATPTPTPGGPTQTPGPTSTFQPLWNACLDFTANAFGFSSEAAIYVADTGFRQTSGIWSFGRSGVVAGQKKKIRIDFAPGQTFTGDIRLSDNGANATTWKAATGNSIIVDFSGEAWLPNTTFWVEFDGNSASLTAQKLCWLDPNPATKTPTPGPTPTGTLPTRTPFPFASPTQTATSYRTPVTPFVMTSTAGVFITSTPNYHGSGGSATPGASTTPGSGGGIPQNSGDAGAVLGSAWDIGTGLFKVGGAYLGQVGDVAGGLLGAIGNASPQPISGLPQCMTNPMKHDICAIYYIMHWTLLAPNTPGALIIPFIMILMNFFIVVRFMRWGWKIIGRGEEMSSE